MFINGKSKSNNGLTKSSASSPSTCSSTFASTCTHHLGPENASSLRTYPLPPPQPPPRNNRSILKQSPVSSNGSPSSTSEDTSGYDSLNTNVRFSMTPAGKFFTQFFSDAMQYFNHPMHNVIWSEEPPTTCMSGNNIITQEKIINSDDKFSVEIDVSVFLLEELSITYDYNQREIHIEGCQKKRDDGFDSVERSFKCKYDIADDVEEESLAAYLTPEGFLTVQARKKSTKKDSRRIPIQAVSYVPDLSHQTATNITTNQCAKFSGTGKTKISPPVPPKPKFLSKQLVSEYRENPEVNKEFENVKKPAKKETEVLDIKHLQQPKNEPKPNKEYLNIFC
ncbi:unnamed protein product [Thelazia callipaeda]|uniref:SHSP domain-containing protein n=1 Tax=Thelazia callipaeda TaxID=103827 RepID=A0A0N5DCA6_THECL|nr:unnamed protein product [Thelazia callipaeda]